MKLTIEQKYEWLCSRLHITDIDPWEHDASLKIRNLDSIVFYFGAVLPATVDEAIGMAMGRYE